MKFKKAISFALGCLLAIVMMAIPAVAMEKDKVVSDTDSVKNEINVGDLLEGIHITPDGNLTLVDDMETADGKMSEDYSTDFKLITVKTRNENVYYIVIDKTREKDNVYFLNLVDDADLMAILEGTKVSYTPLCTCTEKCETGNPNENCPVCKKDAASCKGAETVKEIQVTQENKEMENEGNKGKLPILPIVIIVLAAGGIIWYIKFGKQWLKTRGTDSPETVAQYCDDDEDNMIL